MTSLVLASIVSFAGAIGALTRYLLGRFISERVNAQFPLGTFLINVTGAFCIGLLFSLAAHKLIGLALQSVLATGFLGGYTTFSTMSWEGVQLARGGSTLRSALYLGGSLGLGVVAVAIGTLIGGWL